MIPRARCEEAFRAAVDDCDPERLVRDTVAGLRIVASKRIGIAMGKAALPMARGAGAVARGVAVTNADDGRDLPPGWTKIVASHPEPDERSLEAGDAVIDAVASASRHDRILALVSGGASALVERPAAGVTLDQLRADIRRLMAGGAPIQAINRRRVELSAIKGGKLAAMSEAPITTLLVSDVIDDDPAVIGSGPTYEPDGNRKGIPRGEIVVASMDRFARAMHATLGGWLDKRPLTGAVEKCARDLASETSTLAHQYWGEPVVRIPDDHGEGGRAQQLALWLAYFLRSSGRSAFVAGSDGIDGPPPRDRPAPAGAYVDGHTWDAIVRAGIDPQRALARCDAGTALAAVGALFVPGPTGVNHADVVVMG